MTEQSQIEDLSDLIQITDTYGRANEDFIGEGEPLPGSVVLDNGEWGTAWQRHFSDGLWHSTRCGKPKTWEQMLQLKRNMVLAYDADERE